VHGVIESTQEKGFRRILNDADLITPDGMPLVWGLRRLGLPFATRVYGPDLTLDVCKGAAAAGVSIALYGGTQESLARFSQFLESRFPAVKIVCAISPPFRPLSIEEDNEFTRLINDSGASIVLVGIGCPKQERWMSQHKGTISAVMLGVGAAFDFHAGRVRQAPSWVQRAGLEWFFRLVSEPRRLWKRYFRIVPRFIALFGIQLAQRLLVPARAA
jgi:N-acetylglucosaminyldiphosphoundecaprenol N-acetyl-beta-D-mannosaminyltransferase